MICCWNDHIPGVSRHRKKPMQILLLRAEQPVPRGGAAAHFYGKDRNSFRAASS